MTRLGYQIPNFTYPDSSPTDIFDSVARQAREADESGFDTVMAMDHLYQLPMLGPPELEMLECYTLLAALAQHTRQVRLSALVTGNTYREPAFLAKTVTTLDHVSGGRAQLGIGAGWFELEHSSLGFEFGTFSDRFERLEESLQIIRGMLAGERPSLDGKWYRVDDAINSPAPIGKIPILIGGGGERKTLRMVAQYADCSNIICALADLPRKLEALNGHCEALGRDRSEIVVSYQMRACVSPTHEQARGEAHSWFESKGLNIAGLSEEEERFMFDALPYGNPESVAERVQAVLDLGVDGVTISLPANGHVPERVALLGSTLAPLVS